jgi:hypothetical protein
MASFFEQLMNPASQGILNTAAGLLQASGPSLRPVSFGQALGQGFQQGTQAYQGAQQAQLQQQLLELKKQQMMAPPAPIVGSPGSVIFDPVTRQPIFSVPTKPSGPTIVPPGSAVLGEDGKPTFTNPAKPDAPSNIALLIKERDMFPPGDPRRAVYDAAITKATTSQPLVQVNTGSKETDKIFAGEHVAFATGGYADVVKQLDQLQGVITALENEENITGPVVGNVPRGARAVTHPRSVAVQEELEEVAQRNLRLILGAQFTEKEGERLISRAYNPALPQEENTKRVKRLFTQIKEAADAKLEASRYFMANGTLQGWKGKTWTMKDFDPEKGDDKPVGKKATGPKKGDVVDGWEFKGGDPANQMNWRKK